MDTDKLFSKLKSILAKYELKLAVLHNKNDNYYLNTPTSDTNKKPDFLVLFKSKNHMWHFT